MKNIHPVFDKIVSREAKEERLKQKAKVIWFTGLSGSGKTTVSSALEKKLFEMGYFTQLLDGDNIRTGINNNLGFSQEDRLENIRRIAEVSKLIMNCGVIVLCAFISPTDKIRNMAKSIIGEDDFIEVFVDTPIEVCEQRDVKGLYEKARKGIIKDFTGVSAPFDKPADANVIIDTSTVSLEESVEKIFGVIKDDITVSIS
ncbi:adenylyl-sulfate kinase [uncultured Draconibacterium sp.]|uniref:adenylyl-sulfate kinase n=1 Tax=uncultured Draconibacterium sp. TaxID=1573823 RepID=UPI002AA74043|nr:adenylyl-sulfate kinase [uncultured Draconibacterium sp.]